MGGIIESIVDHWASLYGLLVLAGLTVYVVASHTLHQRRHPSAAVAWVVSLVLLPYLALPLYLLFGRRKLVSQRRFGKPDRSAPAATGPASAASGTQQLAAAMGLPAVAAYRQMSIHQDGAQARQALRDMLGGATRSIDLCTFVFGKDGLGGEIAERLMRRAAEGIRVRLLVDGVGAYLGGLPDLNELAAAGIHVALFVPPFRSTLQGRTNLRNHRKMVIADGEWFWCGGRNLAAEYFEGDSHAGRRGTAWVDLSFDLRGALATQAQQQFERDWAFATQGTVARPVAAGSSACPEGGTVGQLVASGPDQADDTLYTLLISGFFLSRRRILAVSPYFVPDPTLLMSLTLAARRGVAVDLLMPAKSNHRLADLARHRALRELVAAGAHVWFLPRMIHAKAVVIDHELALVGSANLDERSLFLNYELMVSFYAKADVDRFADWIETQRQAATAYRAKRAGLLREIGEGLLLWLAFQL